MRKSFLFIIATICSHLSLTKASNVVVDDDDIKFGDVTFSASSLWQNNFGSCGFSIPPNQYATAALSMKYMKIPQGVTNPNFHPFCTTPTCLIITDPDRKRSVVMRVGDSIQGTGDNLNIADTAFSQLTALTLGRVFMRWKFVDCSTHPLGPTSEVV